MRRIVHLSDLHFGRHDPDVVASLIGDVAAQAPDLIAVSGDLTQRARSAEFDAARRFLDQFAVPLLVVPGNHDVPLYNLGRRLFGPLARYRRWISVERLPLFVDDEIAVIGLDTARALTISGGRISARQIGQMIETLGRVPSDRFKIVMTHHPLIPPPGRPDRAVLGGARAAIAGMAAAGVDLVLAGHFHLSFTADLAESDPGLGRSILVAHAGTATSTRHRSETNTYNVIDIAPPSLRITVRAWAGNGFAQHGVCCFIRQPQGWTAIP